MKVKIQETNPGTWFPFNEENKEDGGLCVRITNSAIIENIAKACDKKKSEYAKAVNDPSGRAQRFEWIETDEDLAFEMRWDYCIVDWKNLTDENNEQIPCTKENKVKLMREQIVFSAFVLACLRKLNQDIKAEMEEQAKNLFGMSKDISGTSIAAIAE